MSRIGQFYVLCAPSGTGKSTLVRRLTREFPSVRFSVSYTTRAPREGEVHGKDYFFTDKDEFMRLAGQGFFAEWAEVHGNCYGTPLEFTRGLAEQGFDVLFDIDVQGARQLKESLPGACFAMLLPPSRASLEARLRGRGTDDEATIAKRMRNAAGELAAADMFDYWIVNDDLEKAYDSLRAVYLARTLVPSADPGQVSRLLAQWEGAS
ncbi:Guanylate kinase [Desulfovibrio sp. X2]|uniref:guanylate kinase n=1 Tax=Desulfovibrio sp. X2 TaxID=941449 RepID=UPI0003587563|nr:guanylate kinase [Desulfovibrio sp. X2]EPR41450.1 Guanylate kinase [Desulfovibrio sp. X2]